MVAPNVWKYISDIIVTFSGNFVRQSSFIMFIALVVGTATRHDHLGITSCIRALGLEGKEYTNLLHLFRASSWHLMDLWNTWISIVAQKAPLLTVNDHYVVLMDGCKGSKEGFFMPGVQKIKQDSETQSKAEFIFGNMFGALAIVASRGGSVRNLAAIPVLMTMQLGIACMLGWLNNRPRNSWDKRLKKTVQSTLQDIKLTTETHTVQMFRNACITADVLKHDMYLIGDRLFLSRAGIKILNEYNEKNDHNIHFITRCRISTSAWEDPPEKEPGKRGPKKKKGNAVKLSQLMDNSKLKWITEEIEMYGVKQEVTYIVLDLLWGLGIYQKVRFVLVKYNGKRTILVSTDLSLSGKQIIELYCIRARIESSFRELKQVIGGFAYHFWTKALPKLNHFKKSSDPDPLEAVTDWTKRRNIALAVRAVDFYVLVACIAIGILQMISVKFEFEDSDFRWQRTPVNLKRPSEANIQEFLQRTMHQFLLGDSAVAIGDYLKERFRLGEPDSSSEDETHDDIDTSDSAA